MQHTRWSNTRHALHGDVAPEEVGQYKHSTDLGSGAWVPNGPDIRWIELGVTNVVLLLAGALAGFWTCAVHGMCTKCVFSCVMCVEEVAEQRDVWGDSCRGGGNLGIS